MPTFSYRAKSGPERVVEGLVEAESRLSAMEKLSRRGYFPLSLEEFRPGRRRPGGRRGVSAKDLSFFTRQMADLLDSGVPILKALRVAQEQTDNPRLEGVLKDLVSLVEGGKSLSQALGEQPGIFPPLYVSLVRAGEVGGVLPQALARLADFTEQDEELRSRILSAMVYPGLIASVGAATVVFLMAFVVPRMTAMFADMGQDLPLITRLLAGISHGVRRSVWALPVLAAGGVLAARRLRGLAGLPPAVDRFLLNLPLWGALLKKLAVARFARTLAALLSGGVPILDALRVVADVLGHPALKEQVLEAARAVQQGAGLSESLRAAQDFPPFIAHMVAVGEEGNALEKSLNKVAATFERETDRAVKMLTSLLEPLLILAAGAVIGLIVMALLLPVFQIPTLVK